MVSNQKHFKGFAVIPAVDLLDGQVVRLFQGAYDQATVYGNDPAAPIRDFIAAGAQLIHIVDLNAARNGERKANRAAISAILAAVGEARRGGREVLLEIGGGVRDLEAIGDYLGSGVDRVILGTAAVRDPELVAAAIERYGPARVVVGVDARDGEVRVSGWEESSGLAVADFFEQLIAQGVEEVIYTNIATDGALSGPPLDELRDLLVRHQLRLIASGGVASNSDVEALVALSRQQPLLVGVITGRAIYEGRIDLSAAVRAAEG